MAYLHRSIAAHGLRIYQLYPSTEPMGLERARQKRQMCDLGQGYKSNWVTLLTLLNKINHLLQTSKATCRSQGS